MKQRSTPSFAQIVEDAKRAPRPLVEPADDGSRLTDPAGRTWHEVEAPISPGRARELVADGAALAWDDCGSRGYGAPVDWLSTSEATALAADGLPVLRTKRDPASELSAWATEDGASLVLATRSVRWGRRLA